MKNYLTDARGIIYHSLKLKPELNPNYNDHEKKLMSLKEEETEGREELS
jgi:hypothetical protein